MTPQEAVDLALNEIDEHGATDVHLDGPMIVEAMPEGSAVVTVDQLLAVATALGDDADSRLSREYWEAVVWRCRP